ncbi:MAG: hypothetical protein Q7V10_02090 [Methanobacteriaceae archaeon]|nr:hypothetical protein [Methanobacteriaceae archaeon]MDO9625998.1 hypothetical protein [Methanobacteriaceae archaeon]
MAVLRAKWEPATFEEKLIFNYSLNNPGIFFLEVPVGNSAYGKWPKKSKIRRIDAINIKNSNSKNEIYSKKLFSYHDFKNRVSNKSVQLIETKKKLNRFVIGQVIAGYDMFEREFNPQDIEMVVLCVEGDRALEWVCKKRNIKIEKIDITPKEDEEVYIPLN